MRSIIIYFSITGNTKKIAQAIHKGIKGTGEQCDIIRLRDVDAQDLAGYDLIGLGSPVMRFRELANVTNFLEYTLEQVEGKHGFAFCTHGALPSHYLSRVVPAMKQRSLTIIGWNNWFGSVYFPVIPKPYFTDGHPDEIDLKEAEIFGQEMIERSLRVYAGETHLIPAFPTGRDYDEIYDPIRLQQPQTKATREDIRKKMSNSQTVEFKVDNSKCRYPQCTFCIDNCPTNAIDFSVSPPLFNIRCDQCWLCEMACPQGAIEVDFTAFQSNHDQELGRLQRSLEIFEARGDFRRLVPLEEIGWDTPFWTYEKPRYKIDI